MASLCTQSVARTCVVGLSQFPCPAAQWAMGAAFIVMGGSCVVAPSYIIRNSFTPAFLQEEAVAPRPLSVLVTQCFGLQAVLAGILLSTSRMDRRAHLIWGAAMLPFVWFDIHFHRRGVLTALGAGGDLLGNIFFIACSLWGSGILTHGLAALRA